MTHFILLSFLCMSVRIFGMEHNNDIDMEQLICGYIKFGQLNNLIGKDKPVPPQQVIPEKLPVRVQKNKLSCPYSECKQTFFNKSGRTKHIRTKHINVMHEKVTPREMKDKNSLDHETLQNTGNPKPLFICKQCKMVCTRPCSLAYHVKFKHERSATLPSLYNAKKKQG